MKSSGEVSVYILASGKGTRMGEMTKIIPKPLLPLNGKPIICRLLDYLLEEGFQPNVNYAYLKDEWGEIISQYNSTNFYDTSALNNIVQCFFFMLKNDPHISDVIVLMSADLFFDYRLIPQALNFHNQSLGDVTLILNKKCGRWKKWVYDIKGDDLIDIKISDVIQSTERYFLIFSRKALINYTKNFTVNIGHTQDEFDKNSSYGKGLCFLTKNMLDFGLKVKYKIFDDALININSVDDFRIAEHIANELDAKYN